MICDLFRHINKSECFLPNVVGQVKNKGKCDVKVLDTDARWFGVTYHEDKPALIENINKLIDAGEYPKKLW